MKELRGDRPSIQLPIKVAKGTFDLNASCLPEPFLLAVNGAINFSSHVGTMLMPVCPSEDDCEDSYVLEDEDVSN